MPDVCRAYDAYEAYEVWKGLFLTHSASGNSFHRLRAVPLPRRGRSGGFAGQGLPALPSIGYRGFAVAPMTLRAPLRGTAVQPTVANTSDRCNDATQRCKCISQLQFSADILPTFDFPPQRPPSSREGDRRSGGRSKRRRWKELSGGGRSSRRKASNPIFEHKDCKKTDDLLYYNVRSGLPSAVPAPHPLSERTWQREKAHPPIFGHPRRVRPDFC